MIFTNCKKGRLVAAFGEHYLIELENSMETKKAVLSGKLKHSIQTNEELPSVGDYVQLKPNDYEGPWIIVKVFERKNVLKRKIVNGNSYDAQVFGVNLDELFIVSSLNQDLNLKRLDRYLMIAREANLTPTLLFTKKDLINETELSNVKKQIEFRYPNLKVIYISKDEISNINFLKETFIEFLKPQSTWALIGSSGVGKSTFINAFLDSKIIKTKEIRLDDGKGRHTTTHRELHRSILGINILDSPGIRELEGFGEEVHLDFKHIEEIATKCKFRNCRHLKDPGCAIEFALNEGTILKEELESFLKLYNKESFDLRKMSPEEKTRVRDSWKKKAIRNRKDQKLSRQYLNGRY